MKDANAAITLLEKLPEKIQASNGIRTHDLCVTGAMLSTSLRRTLGFWAHEELNHT